MSSSVGMRLARSDEDECATGTHNCEDPFVCGNTPGGSVCNCVVEDRDSTNCVNYD